MNKIKLTDVLLFAFSISSYYCIALMFWRIYTQGQFIAVEPNLYILYLEMAGVVLYGVLLISYVADKYHKGMLNKEVKE